MQKITPCIWFESGAKDAADFYVSIFPNSKIKGSADLPDAPGPKDQALVTINLNGNEFMLLNGGPNPDFKRPGVVSFVILCDDQKEIDYYWDKLTEGGQENVCGWLTDKYGTVWQVTPRDMDKLILGNKNAFQAMMKMKKIIIADLENA